MSLKLCLENFLKSFQNFSSQTSLHGFSYIVNKTLSFSSRVLWLVVVAVQLYACYYYAFLIIARKNVHPVLLAFDSKSTFAAEVNSYTFTNFGPNNFKSFFQFPIPAIVTCGPGLVPDLVLFNLNTTAEIEKFRNRIIKIANFLKVPPDDVENALAMIFPVPNKFIPWHPQNESKANVYKIISGLTIRNSFELSMIPLQKIYTKFGSCHSYNQMNTSEIFREAYGINEAIRCIRL